MNKFDEKLRKMAAEEKIEISDDVKQKIEETLSILPETDRKIKRVRVFPRVAAIAACFMFLMIFIMPNVSVVYARAMEKVPLLGNLIHVITIRNYFYSDPYHEMDIDVPNISDPSNNEAVDHINKDVNELTDELMKQFYKDLEEIGDNGHGSIKVDYDIVTNTEDWFTLKLSVHMIAGSGSSYFKYYHIDRNTGKNVKLGDLFKNDSFSDIITENIKDQMRKEMEEDSYKYYWIDKEEYSDDFIQINDNHNFYFDKNGDIVIPFDKYEVAPGSMGCPEFTIEKEVIKNILK